MQPWLHFLSVDWGWPPMRSCPARECSCPAREKRDSPKTAPFRCVGALSPSWIETPPLACLEHGTASGRSVATRRSRVAPCSRCSNARGREVSGGRLRPSISAVGTRMHSSGLRRRAQRKPVICTGEAPSTERSYLPAHRFAQLADGRPAHRVSGPFNAHIGWDGGGCPGERARDRLPTQRRGAAAGARARCRRRRPRMAAAACRAGQRVHGRSLG